MIPPATLEWFVVLAKGLIWAAGVVLALALIGAIAIATSGSSLPLVEDLQRESRGIAAIGTFTAGLTAAGVLSGLGAILRLMVADRLGIENETRTAPESGDTGR